MRNIRYFIQGTIVIKEITPNWIVDNVREIFTKIAFYYLATITAGRMLFVDSIRKQFELVESSNEISDLIGLQRTNPRISLLSSRSKNPRALRELDLLSFHNLLCDPYRWEP